MKGDIMALTRKMLKALGIDDEKIDQIIEEHVESVDAWKKKVENADEIAEQLKAVTKERDELQAKVKESGSISDELAKVKEDFEKYKSEVVGKETAAAKEKAVKEYFESKSITGKNLDIALRGCKDEIDSIELKDGKIVDTVTLDELVSGTYSGLVVKTTTQGANVANPPANNGGKTTMSKSDILGIKDTATRQKAIAENPSLFGISTD
jgi:chaperonin cofactor prefoldin